MIGKLLLLFLGAKVIQAHPGEVTTMLGRGMNTLAGIKNGDPIPEELELLEYQLREAEKTKIENDIDLDSPITVTRHELAIKTKMAELEREEYENQIEAEAKERLGYE